LLNRNLFKSAIVRAGYTQRKLAEEIGISNNTFSHKMTGVSCFDTEQIDKICEILNISDNTEKANIFLATPSQIWETTDTETS